MGIIYKLTSPDNISYIGQTIRSINKRLYDHKNGKPYCRVLKEAINNFGFDNFKKEIIWEGDNNLLSKMEKYYIEYYNTLHPNGYNLSSGGGKGEHRSKDTVKRMIKNQRNITKNKNNGLLGYLIENKSKVDGRTTSWSFGTNTMRWGTFKTKDEVLNFQIKYTENPDYFQEMYKPKRTKNGSGCIYQRKDRKDESWYASISNKYLGKFTSKEDAEIAIINYKK